MLAKAYRRGLLRRGSVAVLNGVSFEVAGGEAVALLGANGAGKTTILHAIAGLVQLDSGTIEARGNVALCSSADRSFYYRLSLRENLRFFGALAGLQGRELRERVQTALDVTDLNGPADRRYSACSTGMRQRLTLARALLSDADILLLDEPTRGIDPLHAQQIHRFIREELVQRRKKAIVLATNVLDEAWSVGDRVFVIAGGSARETSTGTHRPGVDELFAGAAG